MQATEKLTNNFTEQKIKKERERSEHYSKHL